MVNCNGRYKIPLSPWDGRSLLENGRHWHLLEVKFHFRISHPKYTRTFSEGLYVTQNEFAERI